MFLIPHGGRAVGQGMLDSWVITEYKISCPAENIIWGLRAVAGNKKEAIIMRAHRKIASLSVMS
jgi:hypothetical protein